MQVIRIVGNLQAHKFGSLYQSVDTNGKVLTADVDISGIKQRQHAMCLQFFQIFVVGQLHLVHEVDDVGQEHGIIHAVVDGILHTTVKIDGKHAF